MDNNTFSLLIPYLFCFGCIGVLVLLGVVFVFLALRRKQASGSPQQTATVTQTQPPAQHRPAAENSSNQLDSMTAQEYHETAGQSNEISSNEDSTPEQIDNNFVPDQSLPPNTTSKKSKADKLYDKGWQSFWDSYTEQDKDKRDRHLSKAQGYLTMAYKAAGDDIEEKKGIAGLMAVILTGLDDCKNAETWAKAELSINPTNVYAKLAWYWVELDKLVGHKGFVTQSGGSGVGVLADILTKTVDIGRVEGKKNAVHQAAIDAAKAIDNNARNAPEPNPFLWVIWSSMLLEIIENMWTNKMKEPYLCNVIISLPWNRFTEEQLKDLEELIEEIQVGAHGFLGRLK